MKRTLSLLTALVVSVCGMACVHAEALVDDRLAAVQPEPGAVDLNHASEGDLIALPGIGPSKAAAILEYRKKHGAFKRVDDLRNVKGFGRKTVAHLRPMVTVEKPQPPAAGTSEVAAAAAAAGSNTPTVNH